MMYPLNGWFQRSDKDINHGSGIYTQGFEGMNPSPNAGELLHFW